MNCDFSVAIRYDRIGGSNPDSDWRTWLQNIWNRASPNETALYSWKNPNGTWTEEKEAPNRAALIQAFEASPVKECWRSKMNLLNNSSQQARCLPTSRQSQDASNYQRECVTNNPTVQNTLGRFYGSAPESVANYQAILDSKAALANSELIEIKNLVGTSPKAISNLDTQIHTKEMELKAVNDEIKELEEKVEAKEQQFVDDKKATGKTVKKSKLNVLQDYLLAGFFIGYLFFGLVAIFYVSKINDYSWKIFSLMTLLVILIGGLMTAVITYVG